MARDIDFSAFNNEQLLSKVQGVTDRLKELRSAVKDSNKELSAMELAIDNVQDNFRLQLFDERKLEFVNGGWNIENCVGNTFLNELNISSYKDLSRVNIIKQINNIINQYYTFYGYTEFANDIVKTSQVNNATLSENRQRRMSLRQLDEKYSEYAERYPEILEDYGTSKTAMFKNSNVQGMELINTNFYAGIVRSTLETINTNI